MSQRQRVFALSAFLFATILALRVAYGDAGDATLLLFVVPIALCAIEFGTRGGLAASTLALALAVGCDVASDDYEFGPLGLATRATAYFLVGGLLGKFVNERRALEEEVGRHYELSLDLFCTATFDGYFERLNPAWEKTLGHTQEELCSRPFIDFVHPEDRERTQAEAAKLADVGTDTISFRNRYRSKSGEYRWLEWQCHAVAAEERIYATARDVSVQQRAEATLQSQSELLERNVGDRTQALDEARVETLQRLALAAEFRDDNTHQHTERVGRTAALIARQLGLSQDTVALMRRAAPLHDIGKIGIADAILLKPGKLTADEFQLMQQHVGIGARILADGKFAVLQLAREIALTHHEHWDGSGYPSGLAREAISLGGRIVAVADVFDALTHDRPYKEAWPLEDAVAEVERLAGCQFDPDVVEAFAALDHAWLLAPVEQYDLELPAPPLRATTEGNGTGMMAIELVATAS